MLSTHGQQTGRSEPAAAAGKPMHMKNQRDDTHIAWAEGEV